MKTKIIAMYLPQFHEIPENNEFWGKGFTDWLTVKRAKPLYEGHDQPKIPLNNNYYDLSQKASIKWQTELAKKYGVYGFGIYHYWFNSEKNILTKPAQIILENDDIDINYFYIWDNGSWARSWSNIPGNDWAPTFEDNKQKIHKGKAVLIQYILGTETDWVKHFDYLLPFFKDRRHLKINNSPVFGIYNYSKELEPMMSCWNNLAKKNGFNGMHFIFHHVYDFHIPKSYHQYFYEPLHSSWRNRLSLRKIFHKIMQVVGMNFLETYSYDGVWRNILRTAQRTKSTNISLGAFVAYDDTPRRGVRGKLIKGSTPEKFHKYLSRLIKISQAQNKEFIFLTAWNEWGEGAFLEPDMSNRYNYLYALKDAVEENK